MEKIIYLEKGIENHFSEIQVLIERLEELGYTPKMERYQTLFERIEENQDKAITHGLICFSESAQLKNLIKFLVKKRGVRKAWLPVVLLKEKTAVKPTLSLPISCRLFYADAGELETQAILDYLTHPINVNILVAEDHPEIAVFIKNAFSRSENNININVISDGKKAWKFYQAQHLNIDLVIVDYKLPSMNGNEILCHIRDINQDQAVIAITAHGNDATERRFKIEGVNSYLSKPFKSVASFRDSVLAVIVDACVDQETRNKVSWQKWYQGVSHLA